MKKITYFIIIFVICVFFFLLIRFMINFVIPFTEEKNFCEMNYGTKIIDSEPYFGKFCVKPNYQNRTITKYYYTNEDVWNYCGRIGFWELNKWSNKCS